MSATSIKRAANRTKWTTEQRQRAVVASLVAGASINEVAERFGVNPSLLSTWRRKHAAAIVSTKPAKRRARFAAVRVKSIPTDGFIEIDLVARCVRVHGIVDAGLNDDRNRAIVHLRTWNRTDRDITLALQSILRTRTGGGVISVSYDAILVAGCVLAVAGLLLVWLGRFRVAVRTCEA